MFQQNYHPFFIKKAFPPSVQGRNAFLAFLKLRQRRLIACHL
ncbi:hypothetical protein FTV88_2624 [Heliorestis convoluta]|uniref:Uncharacterized protein n=1 Tax=Heliorestis convoluta TaxID=356322 RepID=A0A5Q2N1M5_9FIRM|nr:hypothetical protein FTV88_2624 [Heliorestis convoluta]